VSSFNASCFSWREYCFYELPPALAGGNIVFYELPPALAGGNIYCFCWAKAHLDYFFSLSGLKAGAI
jgi:hypothetical protein